MKRKLKDFISLVVLIVFLFLGCLYYLNFETKGDTGFVTTDEAVVYQTPNYNGKIIGKVFFGDDITIVRVGQTNLSFVKIRLNDDKRTKIGYVQRKMIGKYEFPDVDYTDSNFLIFCDRDISLEDFIPEFRRIIEDKSIIGVYFDKEVIDEKNESDLELFCSSQKIPWGIVKDLTENSIETYEEAESLENAIPPIERFEDYNTLPIVFKDSDNSISYLIDEINIPFVLLTDYVSVRNDVLNWVNTDVKSFETETAIVEESIYAYTYEKHSSFSLVKTSESWSHEIRDAYETAREEATE